MPLTPPEVVGVPSPLAQPYPQPRLANPQCETPTQVKDRRRRKRDQCRRFKIIRVPAHTRRVCDD